MANIEVALFIGNTERLSLAQIRSGGSKYVHKEWVFVLDFNNGVAVGVAVNFDSIFNFHLDFLVEIRFAGNGGGIFSRGVMGILATLLADRGGFGLGLFDPSSWCTRGWLHGETWVAICCFGAESLSHLPCRTHVVVDAVVSLSLAEHLCNAPGVDLVFRQVRAFPYVFSQVLALMVESAARIAARSLS